jgi:GAF domain-containing protein
MQESTRLVLTLGLTQQFEAGGVEWLHVIHAHDAEDVLRHLTGVDVAVLLLGAGIDVQQAIDILTLCGPENSSNPPVATIILCSEPDTVLFQNFVDTGRIFYLAHDEISSRDLRELVLCGARQSTLITDRKRDWLSADDRIAGCVLDLCTRLPMQIDLASAGRLLIETGHEVLRTKIVQCFVYDPDIETLTSVDASEDEKWTYSAASGLIAFVARTGERVCVDRVGTDPRYDPDIDAPQEMSNGRFLAQPIIGYRGLPAGVLTVVRSSEQAAFSSEEIRLVELLAELSAPTFNQILLQNRVQARLTKRAFGSEANASIYRQEALNYHVRGLDYRGGDVLTALPGWLRRTSWVVLGLFLAALLVLPFLWWNNLGKVIGK